MAGRHRRPLRKTLGEAVLYLALALLAFACIAGIVIGLGGGRR